MRKNHEEIVVAMLAFEHNGSSLAEGLFDQKRKIDAQTCGNEVKPTGRCSRDLNSSGHPSLCDCGAFQNYDASVGMCKTIPDAVTPPELQFKSSVTACTRDIGPHGYPSNCKCSDGGSYNNSSGKCEAN